ncbi:MAG: hypothetical protein HY540_05605 [Deltaproteobacteria bacterium]|nr:hypothetical protein [Deltaproteobacteria bacterium]
MTDKRDMAIQPLQLQQIYVPTLSLASPAAAMNPAGFSRYALSGAHPQQLSSNSRLPSIFWLEPGATRYLLGVLAEVEVRAGEAVAKQMVFGVTFYVGRHRDLEDHVREIGLPINFPWAGELTISNARDKAGLGEIIAVNETSGALAGRYRLNHRSLAETYRDKMPVPIASAAKFMSFDENNQHLDQRLNVDRINLRHAIDNVINQWGNANGIARDSAEMRAVALQIQQEVLSERKAQVALDFITENFLDIYRERPAGVDATVKKYHDSHERKYANALFAMHERYLKGPHFELFLLDDPPAVG